MRSHGTCFVSAARIKTFRDLGSSTVPVCRAARSESRAKPRIDNDQRKRNGQSCAAIAIERRIRSADTMALWNQESEISLFSRMMMVTVCMTLTGKVALIIGSTSGLGRHFATVLAAAGETVILTARRGAMLEAVAAL